MLLARNQCLWNWSEVPFSKKSRGLPYKGAGTPEIQFCSTQRRDGGIIGSPTNGLIVVGKHIKMNAAEKYPQLHPSNQISEINHTEKNSPLYSIMRCSTEMSMMTYLPYCRCLSRFRCGLFNLSYLLFSLKPILECCLRCLLRYELVQECLLQL